MKDIKVGAICMHSTPDFAVNLKKAEQFVRQAQAQGCEWVVLPEVFSYIGPDSETFSIYQNIHESVYGQMSELAAELGIVLFAGTLPRPMGTDKKLLNTLYVFGRDGKEIACYDKTHLFELRGEDGSIKVSEKKVFAEGLESHCIEIDGFNVFLAICYDLRFLEFFHSEAGTRAIDVVVVPAAFTYETGSVHWELLMRARAIDLQCFTVGATQTGLHFGKRKSFGHAMIVNPWSEVLAQTGATEGVAVADLTEQALSASRSRLQQRQNRRPSLYK